MSLRHYFAFSVGLLVGCADVTSNAVLQTAQHVLPLPRGKIAEVPLDPKLRYLRITVRGREGRVALGYLDQHPRGPIEVWYTAEKEVLRLQGGRVAGATGLPTEWRGVRLPAFPPWRDLASSATAYRWERSRDLMPGYRYGVRDTLVLQSISPPSSHALVGVDPARLLWFEERLVSSEDAEPLPAARYAVEVIGQEEWVIYAEQCLKKDLCFTWQRWPAGS